MKSLLASKNRIMCTGLLPGIVCMVLCIFLPDASVLYTCSVVSIAYILYRVVKPPLYQPNLVLLHATLALLICSIIKGVSGNVLIPDRTVPITLEIILLSFSFLYLIMPGIYDKFFSYFNYKIPILNYWATQVIALLVSIHLFSLCVIYLFFNPLPYTFLYFLAHIAPPLVYILCILINEAFVKSIRESYKKMPSLRIAPVCNGKIYVTPRDIHAEEPGKWDVPMEDYVYTCKTDTDIYAKEVERKYHQHLTCATEPRFSLKHIITNLQGKKKTILLYVLPLEKEDQIHFNDGKFVTPDEVFSDENQYSSFFRDEIDHLGIVAGLWDEYK